MVKDEVRQAVVIIHGIGEQHPMDTLRGFTDSALKGENSDDDPKFWSKPDEMSESFELRRFRSVKLRLRTDFYEYYWAHHMEGTKLSQVWEWISNLLFRLPYRVPLRFAAGWALTWLLVLSLPLLAIVVSGITMPSNGWIAAFILAILAVARANYYLIKYAGDAARYINPSPQNIARRQIIRFEGVRLLKKLHEQGGYDRIIVVGHSLGSMIAYDILRHTWVSYNSVHGHPSDGIDQRALEALDDASRTLSDDTIDDFRDKQRAAWLEQRQYGSPWLVTDFITLGSPLTYASILLASNKDQLNKMKAWREVPTCPPVKEKDAIFYHDTYDVAGGERRTLKVLHHAAPFACTRWTNLYFPLDFIGGPLNKVLGRGIKDIPVKSRHLLSYLPFVSHTWYWRHGVIRRDATDYKESDAIEKLRAALELDAGTWEADLKALAQARKNVPVHPPDEPLLALGVPEENVTLAAR